MHWAPSARRNYCPGPFIHSYGSVIHRFDVRVTAGGATRRRAPFPAPGPHAGRWRGTDQAGCVKNYAQLCRTEHPWHRAPDIFPTPAFTDAAGGRSGRCRGGRLVNAGPAGGLHDEGAEPRLRPFVIPPGLVTAGSCLPAFLSAGAAPAARSGCGQRLPGRRATVNVFPRVQSRGLCPMPPVRDYRSLVA